MDYIIKTIICYFAFLLFSVIIKIYGIIKKDDELLWGSIIFDITYTIILNMLLWYSTTL